MGRQMVVDGIGQYSVSVVEEQNYDEYNDREYAELNARAYLVGSVRPRGWREGGRRYEHSLFVWSCWHLVEHPVKEHAPQRAQSMGPSLEKLFGR